MPKEWIGVDLDGTLASYDGFLGVGIIGGPIPKMVSRVKKWLADGKTVKIMTARVCHPDKPRSEMDKERNAIKAWCRDHIGQELEITCCKDPFMTELWDDRAVRVKKNQGVSAGVFGLGDISSIL